MKRIVSIAVIFLLAVAITFPFFGTDTVARAEESTPLLPGTYRAAADIPVYITAADGQTQLFIIPSTYYFDVTVEYGNNYYITYNGSTEADDYYILSTANFVALSDKDVGTLGGFTVELALTADTTFKKRISSTRFFDNSVSVADTTAISFIGFKDAEKTAAYVRYNNTSFGYIPTDVLKIKDTDTMLADYEIDLHPNYRPVITDDEGNKNKTIDNDKLTRILLIVGIVVPALIIMLLLFKPSKKSRYDYDRNRGYDAGNSPYDRPRSRYRDDYYDEYERPAPPPRRRERDDYDDDYYDRRDGRRY